MILVIDVGNTNITYGVYEKGKMKATFRATTKLPRTSDEYGILLHSMLSMKGISMQQIEGTIIASVVSDVMHSLTGGIRRYLGHSPIIVGPGVKTGIKVVTENPRAIGADRIVDAVAAYEKYGGPVLVLDFGTATTYDLISEEGKFLAGITARRHSGGILPCCPVLRLKSLSPYWRRKPLPVCRQVSFMDKSARRNTSSKR